MRERPPSRYPPNFERWDRERRISHMKLIHTREGMVRTLLALANYPINREFDNQTRLTKSELAAIILALDPDTESLDTDNR